LKDKCQRKLNFY